MSRRDDPWNLDLGMDKRQRRRYRREYGPTWRWRESLTPAQRAEALRVAQEVIDHG